MHNEALAKLGEQHLLQSKIKEKFRELSQVGQQITQLNNRQWEIIKEIDQLGDQAQEVADWLLEQEYKALL